MAYFDRFIVSNQLGASVVAFYTAPAEIIARLGIIPGAFARAIFPRLSASNIAIDRKKNKRIISLILLVVTLPILLLGTLLGDKFMTIWMGDSFSGVPSIILTILLVGFVFNSLAQIPFASIQSRGFAKITAYIHMFELVPYLLMLYFFIKHYGIMGAAFAWSIRMFVDYLILSIVDKSIDRR